MEVAAAGVAPGFWTVEAQLWEFVVEMIQAEARRVICHLFELIPHQRESCLGFQFSDLMNCPSEGPFLGQIIA